MQTISFPIAYIYQCNLKYTKRSRIYNHYYLMLTRKRSFPWVKSNWKFSLTENTAATTRTYILRSIFGIVLDCVDIEILMDNYTIVLLSFVSDPLIFPPIFIIFGKINTKSYDPCLRRVMCLFVMICVKIKQASLHYNATFSQKRTNYKNM